MPEEDHSDSIRIEEQWKYYKQNIFADLTYPGRQNVVIDSILDNREPTLHLFELNFKDPFNYKNLTIIRHIEKRTYWNNIPMYLQLHTKILKRNRQRMQRQ